jgi:hypothetical protein
MTHLGGSRRCTNRLNLGPLSDQSGGKVAARVGGLCGLLTRLGHEGSHIDALHTACLEMPYIPWSAWSSARGGSL